MNQKDYEQIECFSIDDHKAAFPLHFHEGYVLGMMVQGERQMRIGQKTISIKAHDILFIPPHCIHGCSEDNDEKLVYKSFVLPAALGAEYRLDQIEGQVLQDRDAFDQLLSFHETFHPDEADALAMWIRCLFRPSLPSQEIKEQYLELEEIVRYIKENLDSIDSIKDLSHRFGLSPSTLFRDFVQIKGVSPVKYIQSLKIESAKKALKEGRSLKEIAMEHGYYDQSHFSNVFKTLIGITPSCYEKIEGKGKER